jgi:hypothetical protein
MFLVQSQHGSRGASLLLFDWHGFDLVPAAELTNTTGATFHVSAEDKDLLISTLDCQDSRLVIRRYRLDERDFDELAPNIAPPEAAGLAFSAPTWATVRQRGT